MSQEENLEEVKSRDRPKNKQEKKFVFQIGECKRKKKRKIGRNRTSTPNWLHTHVEKIEERKEKRTLKKNKIKERNEKKNPKYMKINYRSVVRISKTLQ